MNKNERTIRKELDNTFNNFNKCTNRNVRINTTIKVFLSFTAWLTVYLYFNDEAVDELIEDPKYGFKWCKYYANEIVNTIDIDIEDTLSMCEKERFLDDECRKLIMKAKTSGEFKKAMLIKEQNKKLRNTL